MLLFYLIVTGGFRVWVPIIHRVATRLLFSYIKIFTPAVDNRKFLTKACSSEELAQRESTVDK